MSKKISLEDKIINTVNKYMKIITIVCLLFLLFHFIFKIVFCDTIIVYYYNQILSSILNSPIGRLLFLTLFILVCFYIFYQYLLCTVIYYINMVVIFITNFVNNIIKMINDKILSKSIIGLFTNKKKKKDKDKDKDKDKKKKKKKKKK